MASDLFKIDNFLTRAFKTVPLATPALLLYLIFTIGGLISATSGRSLFPLGAGNRFSQEVSQSDMVWGGNDLGDCHFVSNCTFYAVPEHDVLPKFAKSFS